MDKHGKDLREQTELHLRSKNKETMLSEGAVSKEAWVKYKGPLVFDQLVKLVTANPKVLVTGHFSLQPFYSCLNGFCLGVGFLRGEKG